MPRAKSEAARARQTIQTTATRRGAKPQWLHERKAEPVHTPCTPRRNLAHHWVIGEDGSGRCKYCKQERVFVAAMYARINDWMELDTHEPIKLPYGVLEDGEKLW